MVKRLVKNKLFWLLLIVVFLSLFSFIKCNKPTEHVDFNKVDSIAAKNDSLQMIINSLDSILQVNKIEYEKVRDSVSSQSVDDDCDFFSKYLENLKKKLYLCK